MLYTTTLIVKLRKDLLRTTQILDIESIRKDFPILKREVNGGLLRDEEQN